MLNAPFAGRDAARPAMQGDVTPGAITPAQLPGATRRPHVCFVAPEAWPVLSNDETIKVVGGAEVQQCIIARMLARSGYRVSMICLDYGQPAHVMHDGIEVFRTHTATAGIPLLRFVHPRLTSVWRAMRQADADIYYQRSAAMLTAVVAAFCRRYGKRSIYAGASDSDFRPGRQMIRYRRDRWLFERGLDAVDAVVVQNETQQQDVLDHYGRQSTLIRSCYELPADSRPGSGECVLWVATLRPDKRPELFLELARRLPHRRFVMIGGPAENDPGGSAYFASVRAMAEQLDNVDFLGFLPHAKAEPWFDRARVVVNTSTFEGMPNVFLQAWARGVPTLAFIDVGARLRGQPLYRVAGDAGEAAAEIERLFSDDIHRGYAAARSREYFTATHGGTEVLARYQRVFDELMRGVRHA